MMQRFSRRAGPSGARRASISACVLCSLLLLAGWPRPGVAREFPAQPVRIIVPYPLSGPTDIRGTPRLTKTYKLIAQTAPPAISDTLARMVEEAIRAGTRQPVRLERQPGGATTVGAARVAHGRPDGHTLLLASNATLLIAPHYYLDVQYDDVDDFVLVAPLATMPFVLMAASTLPVDDVQDLVAWLKVRPGEVNYGSSGESSTGHLAGERLLRMAGVKAVHVAYNGGLAALNAVATRHVSYMFAALPLALTYARSQYVSALGVSSAQRVPMLPVLPTLAESGLPGFEVEAWFGVFAAARTPAQAVAWHGERIGAAMAGPDVQGRLLAHGLMPVKASRAQFATRINSEADETAAFLQIVKAASPPAN